MRYQGSKARFVKYIAPLIIERRAPGQFYVEPFVGGGNMIAKIPGGPKLGCDSNRFMVALLQALASGWIPPRHISEDEYKQIRSNQEQYSPELVGFVGTQATYGSRWYGGYARGKGTRGVERDFSNEGQRACIAQSSGLRGCEFIHSDYRDLKFNKPALIYCDPPYANTTGYNTKNQFDSEAFWKWCADRSRDGHKVIVSEYVAPEGWCEIWSREVEGFHSQTPTGCKVKRPTEKLFERDA